MYGAPEAFMDLLNRLADAVSAHLNAQIRAGAAAVQLFDTWAGILSDEDFCRFALTSSRRALLGVTEDTPTLYFTGIRAHFSVTPYVCSDGIALDWQLTLAPHAPCGRHPRTEQSWPCFSANKPSRLE